MKDVYVLDGNLEQIGIIDSYVSLLWVKRYNTEGDCELYTEANEKNLKLLQKGNYLQRLDDDMVCRIEKIELDTDTRNGNYLIVTGYDVKKILAQRIIWSQSNVDGNVEDYIRNIIYKSLVNPNLSARAIKNKRGQQNFLLGDKAGFTEVTTQQVTYKTVSEKVQEFCNTYGWGYKVIVDIGNFYFVLYKGNDKSNQVVFAPEYENLISTKYIEDSSNLANVALVAGEGEGSARSRNVSGYAESLDRYELYVDARDLSRNISWSELTDMYPTTDDGGYGSIYITSQHAITYKMDLINISIVDNNQLTELQANYPNGQVVTINGIKYYQAYDVIIADLTSDSPQSNDNVVLRDIVYEVYLLNRGYEKLAEYGSTISFEGSVEPDITFKYKRDYDLGDLVTVRNEYKIEKVARIVEIMEIFDTKGSRIEPKFEYTDKNGISLTYLATQQNEILTTQNDKKIIVNKEE